MTVDDIERTLAAWSEREADVGWRASTSNTLHSEHCNPISVQYPTNNLRSQPVCKFQAAAGESGGGGRGGDRGGGAAAAAECRRHNHNAADGVEKTRAPTRDGDYATENATICARAWIARNSLKAPAYLLKYPPRRVTPTSVPNIARVCTSETEIPLKGLRRPRFAVRNWHLSPYAAYAA
jgi:hypothetical protein